MFQRLVAIPQEEYINMSNLRNVHQPMSQYFQNLQKQYQDVEQVRDPYERLIKQSEVLDQMKDVKDYIRQSVTVNTPKPFQNRAKALFQSMENFLKFNDRGELIDEEGSVIPSSRIEDLIQHAVRDRRRGNKTPIGWKQFLNLLHEHNVPKSNLNRYTLDEIDKMVDKTNTNVLQRKIDPIKHEVNISTDQEKAKKREMKLPLRSPMKLRAKRQKKDFGDDFLLNF